MSLIVIAVKKDRPEKRPKKKDSYTREKRGSVKPKGCSTTARQGCALICWTRKALLISVASCLNVKSALRLLL
jgi:hypothetical protein